LVNLIIYMKNPDLITLKKKQTRVNLLNLWNLRPKLNQ
jgi:hypothetical protein